jgi:signal transduction histidine kinase
MSDVSCKAVETCFVLLGGRGVAPERLADATPYTLAFLRDKDNRIPWSDFVAINRSMRELGGLRDEDLEHFGQSVFKKGPLRLAMSLARVFGDPARFYQWFARGNKMFFANVQSRVVVHNPHQVSIHIGLRTDDEQCPEYLLISKGAIASVPTMFGYPAASVHLRREGTEAIYDVTMQPKRPSRIRLALRAVTGRYETAEELLAANEQLVRRLDELQVAHTQIQAQAELVDRQAHRLQLAHEIGKVIHGTFDLQAVLETITAALLDHTAATSVRLRVELTIEGATVAAEATGGALGLADQPLSLPIEIRGAPVGVLTLAARSAGERAELEGSLEYVLPVLAMAIDNARSYLELATYQRGLERLVEERTAELRSARDDLALTVDQLRDAQSARERIFANISHEIRTPLSLILLAIADVEARAGDALDPIARADLGSVVESARRLLRLVDELLLLAAGRETALQVTPQPMDLAKLVAAIAATWRPAADSAGLALTVQGPDSMPLMLDPIAIERVVTNLLSNAVKFTPRGGTVGVEVALDQEQVHVVVRDTGIGIDDDLLQRLFGRFERGTAMAKTRSGSGIGLSLVKELVEAHGGAIAVERLRAGGTEFRVTLPAVAPSGPAVDTAAPRMRPSDFGVSSATVATGDVLTPPGRSTATVLVAEDDPRLAAMISRLLAEEYTVVVALDGLAALELAGTHQPHLLVTDVNMPGMDGIELARRFREATGERLAPVVILSALADLGTRLAGLATGAVDYVVKPFDPNELRARVRSQLGMRDLALRLHRAEQLSALGTLSSGLAHELRNPANAIVNAVGPVKALLPKELTHADAPVGQLLDILASCAEQIGFLSRQLLSFKRGGDLELRKAQLGDLVHKALTLAQPALTGVDVRQQVDVVGPVTCAPPLLVQVLTNLLENAAHAAGTGGWVRIGAAAGGGRVQIEVADSGPGVPVELRDRVFEPFYTTKPPGLGMGLGLPLARDIVHRHGGVLEIRERDRRAIFVVELPYAEAS